MKIKFKKIISVGIIATGLMIGFTGCDNGFMTKEDPRIVEAKKIDTIQSWSKLAREALKDKDEKLFNIAIQNSWDFFKTNPDTLMMKMMLKIETKEDYIKMFKQKSSTNPKENAEEKKRQKCFDYKSKSREYGGDVGRGYISWLDTKVDTDFKMKNCDLMNGYLKKINNLNCISEEPVDEVDTTTKKERFFKSFDTYIGYCDEVKNTSITSEEKRKLEKERESELKCIKYESKSYKLGSEINKDYLSLLVPNSPTNFSTTRCDVLNGYLIQIKELNCKTKEEDFLISLYKTLKICNTLKKMSILHGK